MFYDTEQFQKKHLYVYLISYVVNFNTTYILSFTSFRDRL